MLRPDAPRLALGGLWAVVPDLPHVFREDFPGLAFSGWLGAKSLENWLHQHGNLFFFHSRLDAAEHEWALHGLALILLFYNLAIALLMVLERRQYHRAVEGFWADHARKAAGRRRTGDSESPTPQRSGRR